MEQCQEEGDHPRHDQMSREEVTDGKGSFNPQHDGHDQKQN
jgi:hypothetical protein